MACSALATQGQGVQPLHDEAVMNGRSDDLVDLARTNIIRWSLPTHQNLAVVGLSRRSPMLSDNPFAALSFIAGPADETTSEPPKG